MYTSDIMVYLQLNQYSFLNNKVEPWKITLVDTGQTSTTGGWLRRVKNFIGQETICMTYGDGVSDVNISQLTDHHNEQKVLATHSAVQEQGRFGTLSLEPGQTIINRFREKPKDSNSAWVNGDFFVLEPQIFYLIEGEDTVFEKEPLEFLPKKENLSAPRHEGFWMPMDTILDKNVLEELWASLAPPWKLWLN